MPWQKKVADLLTLTRVPFALAVIGLGLAQGKDGLHTAWVLLLLTATIDTLDGYFARLSPRPVRTWIGAHDLLFDVVFSTALLIYLMLSGVVSGVFVALYLGLWGVVVTATRGPANVRAVIFQGPIYLMTVLAAADLRPRVLLWTAIWLVVMLLFAGRRFVYVRLPVLLRDFFASVRKLSRR